DVGDGVAAEALGKVADESLDLPDAERVEEDVAKPFDGSLLLAPRRTVGDDVELFDVAELGRVPELLPTRFVPGQREFAQTHPVRLRLRGGVAEDGEQAVAVGLRHAHVIRPTAAI